ncbi:MAG: SDR family oxidoreductase [Aerococcus sp.]|nr:SDR family oxidoreductase [Aerococcus sp.]
MFNGRKIMITGVGAGMAHRQAEFFLENGDSVFGLEVNEKALTAAETEFQTYGEQFHGYQADISDTQAVDQVVSAITAEFGAMDVLINTAGIFDKYTKVFDVTEDLWDSIMAVDLKGMFFLTQAVTKAMVNEGKGIVINVTSAAGLRADGGGVAYTVAKHGVVGLTKKLAYELGEKGIRVNAIAPGRITTAMNENTSELIKPNLPAQRNGSIDDIANVTFFLASADSDYMHGQILSVDGGWTVL